MSESELEAGEAVPLESEAGLFAPQALAHNNLVFGRIGMAAVCYVWLAGCGVREPLCSWNTCRMMSRASCKSPTSFRLVPNVAVVVHACVQRLPLDGQTIKPPNHVAL